MKTKTKAPKVTKPKPIKPNKYQSFELVVSRESLKYIVESLQCSIDRGENGRDKTKKMAVLFEKLNAGLNSRKE